MPFLPENTLLNTLDEFINLSHSITYKSDDLIPISYPVTITALDDNETITVSGNTISGFYSDSFENFIHYRNKDDTFTTVNKFNNINITNLYGIHHYQADLTRSFTYRYLAQANGESQEYRIVVTNNWTRGRNELIKYTNITLYQETILTTWINDNSASTPWVNNIGESINWENDTWV
jgi:hypothetical protein